MDHSFRIYNSEHKNLHVFALNYKFLINYKILMMYTIWLIVVENTNL